VNVKIVYVLQRDMQKNSDLKEMIREILSWVHKTISMVSYSEAVLLYAALYKGTYIFTIFFYKNLLKQKDVL
jgi:hypothetical protein